MKLVRIKQKTNVSASSFQSLTIIINNDVLILKCLWFGSAPQKSRFSVQHFIRQNEAW